MIIITIISTILLIFILIGCLFLRVPWKISATIQYINNQYLMQLVIFQLPEFISFSIHTESKKRTISIHCLKKYRYDFDLSVLKRPKKASLKQIEQETITKNSFTLANLKEVSLVRILQCFNKAVRVNSIHGKCQYGFDDAFHTGMIYGYYLTLSQWFPENIDIEFIPDFKKRSRNFEIQLSINVILLYILIELIFRLKVYRYMQK